MATSKKMTTQNKGILIVFIIIIVFAIWYKLIRKDENIEDPEFVMSSNTKGPVTTKSTSAGSGLQKLGVDTLLKKGMKGEEVQWVQNSFNKWASKNSKTKISEDGVFGAKTETAVKLFTGKTAIRWSDWRIYANALDAYGSGNLKDKPIFNA